jgi:hypothetical protein
MMIYQTDGTPPWFSKKPSIAFNVRIFGGACSGETLVFAPNSTLLMN